MRYLLLDGIISQTKSHRTGVLRQRPISPFAVGDPVVLTLIRCSARRTERDLRFIETRSGNDAVVNAPDIIAIRDMAHYESLYRVTHL